MWQGRFRQAPSNLLKTYSESVSFDWRLYRQDIRGSIAHARALLNAGILTAEEFESIESGLSAIRDDIEAGRFVFDPELEDVHMNIEAELTRRIGPRVRSCTPPGAETTRSPSTCGSICVTRSAALVRSDCDLPESPGGAGDSARRRAGAGIHRICKGRNPSFIAHHLLSLCRDGRA